jgi:transposase
MNDAITKETTLTVGLDVGDRHVQVCVLDEAGEVVEESRLPTKAVAIERRFAGCDRMRMVLEAGTHSPWLSRLLEESGHDVLVANPRKLRLIYQNDSGSLSPQLRITKAGDEHLRWMLVVAAQRILGPLGADSDLRRWGLALAEKGGKNGKKRAVVAVARKLSVLLLRLWQTGEAYEPLRNAQRREGALVCA